MFSTVVEWRRGIRDSPVRPDLSLRRKLASSQISSRRPSSGIQDKGLLMILVRYLGKPLPAGPPYEGEVASSLRSNVVGRMASESRVSRSTVAEGRLCREGRSSTRLKELCFSQQT